MSTLVLATANPGKKRELEAALAGLGVRLLLAADAGVYDFPPEDGGSYCANARIKAGFVAARTGLPALADDSGLEIAALGGAPGVVSARFGGARSDAARRHLVLDRLRGVRERRARFVACLVLVTPQGQSYSFQEHCQGSILHEPRGEGGFGYDPIFFSNELDRSFAEASAEEKARVSHRGRALRALLAWATTLEGRCVLATGDSPHRGLE